MIKEFLQGRFLNHPLHPLLVHIPVGLWVASLVFDIIALANHSGAVATTSLYCMGLGIIGALLAAPAGLAEYLEIPRETRPRRLATIHMVMNLAIVVLYIINYYARRNAFAELGAPTVPAGMFVLSIVSIVALSISGYIGGLLVYDYGVGLKPQLRGRPEDEEERRKRGLRRVS